MFERLGSLLNQALESGKLPEEQSQQNDSVSSSGSRAYLFSSDEILSEKEYVKNHTPNKPRFKKISQRRKSAKRNSDYAILKNNIPAEKPEILQIPARVRNAFDILGASPFSDPNACRKIYRTKLKRFHPDNNSDNPVVQKVAAEKTKKLVDAWKIISGYFESKNK